MRENEVEHEEHHQEGPNQEQDKPLGINLSEQAEEEVVEYQVKKNKRGKVQDT